MLGDMVSCVFCGEDRNVVATRFFLGFRGQPWAVCKKHSHYLKGSAHPVSPDRFVDHLSALDEGLIPTAFDEVEGDA